MAAPTTQNLTHLLRSWSEGDKSALDQLVPLVHAELHRLARGYMRGERQGHTLQTTALVNEAFLRLIFRLSRFFALSIVQSVGCPHEPPMKGAA